MEKWLYSVVLRIRNRHLIVLDAVVFSLTPILSLCIRLDRLDDILSLAVPLAGYTVISMAVKLGVFFYDRFYHHYWRYASVDEIVTISSVMMKAWLLCTGGFFAVLILTRLIPDGFPRSLPFIDGILTLVLVGGSRLALRVVYDFNERKRLMASNKNVLIVGAGMAGSTIVKELRSNPQFGLKPVCYADDNKLKKGVMIHGVRVQGSLRDIPRLITEHEISEVIIAMPEAPGEIIRAVVQACKRAHVVSKTIPGVFEILSGSTVAQLREVKIEDLLRRGTLQIETRDIDKLLTGARVMVTGAGGSIGSELCRQIIRFRPRDLVLLGHGENSIFQIANELKDRSGLICESVAIHTVIADIRDRDRMNQVFESHKPDVVFHAAAHKHVGLMQVNTCDAVTNNVEGTKILVELADRHDVKRLVMISSDKAVNPTGIMGVTKRVAELFVHNAAERTGKNFIAVRFGNVLGSSGSVVPLFQKQIEGGGPLKITHPEATRFFMTIPEAVQLVLQAGAIGRGGEIFVLDMGKPIKVLDLALDLLRLSGLKEGVDVDIEFIGLQRGEKLHEELFYDTEKAEHSAHKNILVWNNGMGLSKVSKAESTLTQDVDRLILAAHKGDSKLIQHALVDIVPQYRPNGTDPADSYKSTVKQALVIPIQPTMKGSLDEPPWDGQHVAGSQ
jgi:FlaA1/EpsC-like NDP-sugar epimerase